MQCLSYGTLAGEEFLHHALNLLAEASLVEIESEYILAGIEILQARIVLLCLAYCVRGRDIWMINDVYVEFERRVCLEKTFDHRG